MRKLKVFIEEDDVSSYKKITIYDGELVRFTRTNNIRMHPEDRRKWFEFAFNEFEWFYGRIYDGKKDEERS